MRRDVRKRAGRLQCEGASTDRRNRILSPLTAPMRALSVLLAQCGHSDVRKPSGQLVGRTAAPRLRPGGRGRGPQRRSRAEYKVRTEWQLPRRTSSECVYVRLGVDAHGENRAQPRLGAKPEVPARKSSDISETVTANRRPTHPIEIVHACTRSKVYNEARRLLLLNLMPYDTS